MNNADEFLQQRLRELREDETARSPALARVLCGPVRGASSMMPRLIMAGAAASVLVIVAVLPQRSNDALPEVSPAAIEDLEAAEWVAPSDALLADGATPPNADLMREINQLLNQP